MVARPTSTGEVYVGLGFSVIVPRLTFNEDSSVRCFTREGLEDNQQISRVGNCDIMP